MVHGRMHPYGCMAATPASTFGHAVIYHHHLSQHGVGISSSITIITTIITSSTPLCRRARCCVAATPAREAPSGTFGHAAAVVAATTPYR